MQELIKQFREIRIGDVATVGGKNASLGEMLTTLSSANIKVPDGFATTSEAFWLFIDSNNLRQSLSSLMNGLDKKEFSNLRTTGKLARQMIRGWTHFIGK